MNEEILARLDYDRISREQRPFIGEDFVFATSAFPSVAEFRVVHVELHFEETPLAVVRDTFLQHTDSAHSSLQVTLALAWEGFRDALKLAARFVSAYQRAIPEAAIFNTLRHGIGDFGVAWAWEGKGEADVVSFVRNNVFVGIQGHDSASDAFALASELDGGLTSLSTVANYQEDLSLGLASNVRQREGDVPTIRAGGRLDLGVLEDRGADQSTFFLTSTGSVNRDPAMPSMRYFRAGTEKGRQEIRIFTVGRGILPTLERLIVEVV